MKIEYIKDITNNNFLGINIYPEFVHSYLERMKTILGDEFEEYIKYQQDRDLGKHHCTVFNVSDLNKITKDTTKIPLINDLLEVNINDFVPMGLGTIERQGNKTYFIVIRSSQLQEIRKSFNLDEIDFHVTLGFKYKDVNGLRKNVVLSDSDPFIGCLKQYYLDYNSCFNFCKELEGYKFDLNKDIYCTKITDIYAEFKVGNEEGIVNRFVISLINNRFVISCIWQELNENIPYMADTLILRKLNNL